MTDTPSVQPTEAVWIGPAPREKVYHYAAHFRDDGAVSALCFEKPKAINLKVACWTIREDAVTCQKCRDKLFDLV